MTLYASHFDHFWWYLNSKLYPKFTIPKFVSIMTTLVAYIFSFFFRGHRALKNTFDYHNHRVPTGEQLRLGVEPISYLPSKQLWLSALSWELAKPTTSPQQRLSAKRHRGACARGIFKCCRVDWVVTCRPGQACRHLVAAGIINLWQQQRHCWFSQLVGSPHSAQFLNL